ncbi:MAG: putative oxidoreductase [Planctomycetota bacterium]|jgi:hydroxycarboxylate dehydrogenase B
MTDMRHLDPDKLRTLVQELFERVGSKAAEAERIAFYLVESNLTGHDSHGVIRAPYYIDYVKNDQVRPNQSLSVIFQTDSMAIVDGNFGFGQVIGEQAMHLGVEMAKKHGIATVSLRNSAHLGRIGDWPTYVAKAGMASFHFVNTSGFGLLTAPFGGIDRRLSANPLAAGIPVAGKKPIILDISTCAIAEGKLKVALNKGVEVDPGCIIDNEGNAITDPKDFYTDPPGALLPFGGHKGYGLSIIAEMFAGAFTGNSCTNPANDQRLLNGMFSLIIDCERLPKELGVAAEVQRFIDYVKSSRKAPGVDEILMPGEIEERNRLERERNGIPVDDTTWQTLCDAAADLKIDAAVIEGIIR